MNENHFETRIIEPILVFSWIGAFVTVCLAQGWLTWWHFQSPSASERFTGFGTILLQALAGGKFTAGPWSVILLDALLTALFLTWPLLRPVSGKLSAVASLALWGTVPVCPTCLRMEKFFRLTGLSDVIIMLGIYWLIIVLMFVVRRSLAKNGDRWFHGPLIIVLSLLVVCVALILTLQIHLFLPLLILGLSLLWAPAVSILWFVSDLGRRTVIATLIALIFLDLLFLRFL